MRLDLKTFEVSIQQSLLWRVKIEFFTINTKLGVLSMLASTVFTTTKKLPPEGLDLMTIGSRV